MEQEPETGLTRKGPLADYHLRTDVRLIAALLLVVVVAAILLYLQYLEKQYEDFGVIIVESPEVYPRERLVNDRFLQNAWLESKLKKAGTVAMGNQATTWSDHTLKMLAGVSIGSDPGGGSSTESGDTAHAPQKESGAIPRSTPEQRFQDELGYREAIRAEIMETMLDDRHDLKGNTLYRLKFDVTRVPRRDLQGDSDPLGLVTIRLEDPYSGNGCPWENDTSSGDQKRVKQTYCKALKDETDELYSRWIRDLERELNAELGFRILNYRAGKSEELEAVKMHRFFWEVSNAHDLTIPKEIEYIRNLRSKLLILENGFLNLDTKGPEPNDTGEKGASNSGKSTGDNNVKGEIAPRPLVSHGKEPVGRLNQRNNNLHSYYAPNSNKGSRGEATSILTQGVSEPAAYSCAPTFSCQCVH